MMRIDLPVLNSDSPAKFKVGDCIFGVIGKIGDYIEKLYPEELAHVSRAVKKRQNEYAAGRHFARLALASLGYPTIAIRTGSSRQPLWPDGVIGSIGHSDELALAVVSAKGQTLDAVGVDLEGGRASTELLQFVLTERELRRLDIRAADAEISATLIFSAKESVFKAINPLVNLMIGFEEVEIHLNSGSQTFRAEYIGPNKKNAIINNGLGSYTVFRDHIVCIFVLARGAADREMVWSSILSPPSLC